MTNRRSGSAWAASNAAGELAGPDQQVVGEARPPDGGQPADDVRAQQPVGIRLVVHLVADPDQPFAARRLAERGQVVGDGGARRGPSTPPRRRSAAWPRPWPGTRGSRPVEDRVWTRTVASTPAASSTGSRSRDVEPPPDRGEVVGHPRVVGAGRVPQVVVGVDDGRGHAATGTGAAGSMRPLARRSSHSAGGIGRRSSVRVLVEVGDRPDARDEPGDGRVGERELHRRGADRDAVPLAGLAEAAGPARPPRVARASSRTPRRAAGRRARRCSSRRRPSPRRPARRRPAGGRRAPPGRAACSGRRAGSRRCRPRGRTAPASAPGSSPRRSRGRRPPRAAGGAPGRRRSIAACQ